MVQLRLWNPEYTVCACMVTQQEVLCNRMHVHNVELTCFMDALPERNFSTKFRLKFIGTIAKASLRLWSVNDPFSNQQVNM